MSIVNGRGPQAKHCGRDEAKRKSVRKRLPLRGSRCVGDSPRKPLRHHREAATARDGAKHHREAAPQRKARHHREATASREGARHIGKQLHSAKQSTIGTSNVPNQQHRDAQPAEPTPSRSSYRQGRRKAPSGSSFTAQSKAPSGEQPTEPAALGRASCRTSTIGKQLHSAKQGTFGMSILPNQQHREEHFLANNGAKWAGAEGVRGSNLACFLENFVSNYIVIFYIMLFRVHL